MMGVGKSTIGKDLSKKLIMQFSDIDKIIEKKLKMSIKDIFKKKGEFFLENLKKKSHYKRIKKVIL